MLKTLLLAICVAALPAAPCLAGFVGFRRGDTNGDGNVDLSDGITTLTYLFAGGENPSCEDAADADDSGAVNLSDAIFTFLYLFTGGEPPPAPGPWDCGDDTRAPDGLGCRDIGSCDPQLLSADASGFARFSLSFSPGLGFCPQIGKVFEASITHEDDGSYSLELSILIAGEPGDECLPDIIGNVPCARVVALEPRRLGNDEIAEMLGLFTNMEVYHEPHQICNCIAIDPCRIGNFRWDETSLSDFMCSDRRLGRDLAAVILDFIESLRDDSNR